MSLATFALRLATVRALRGATFAEGRVYDSLIEPFECNDGGEFPAIVVHTYGETAKLDGRAYRDAEREVELAISIITAAALGEDRTGVPGLAIAHQDAGMTLTLDLLSRQVMHALTASHDPWPSLWKKAALNIVKLESIPGESVNKGNRFLVRQLVLTCDTLSEPGYGEDMTEAGDFWADLLAQMRTDGESLGPLADLIEGQLQEPTLESWAKQAAEIGINIDDAQLIGLGPYVPEAPYDEEPAEFIAVKIGEDGEEIDAERLDEIDPPEE